MVAQMDSFQPVAVWLWDELYWRGNVEPMWRHNAVFATLAPVAYIFRAGRKIYLPTFTNYLYSPSFILPSWWGELQMRRAEIIVFKVMAGVRMDWKVS